MLGAPDANTAQAPQSGNVSYLQDQHLGSETDWLHGPLFDLSDTLMQPQFLEHDRIITFEDTYFQASNMDWS